MTIEDVKLLMEIQEAIESRSYGPFATSGFVWAGTKPSPSDLMQRLAGRLEALDDRGRPDPAPDPDPEPAAETLAKEKCANCGEEGTYLDARKLKFCCWNCARSFANDAR